MFLIRVLHLRGLTIVCILIYMNESEQQTIGPCDTLCRYTAYAADAECTNRQLDAVPSAGGVCRSARMFDASYNQITSLDESSFTGFRRMKYLLLHENQISSIGPGTFLPVRMTLEMMNISSNLLEVIGDGTFVNMTRLQYLFIGYNQIAEISPDAFQGMRRLLKLYLSDNCLTHVDPAIFSAMPILREVNLRNNRIVALDIAFIGGLQSLQKIFVNNNSIEEISGEVSTLQSSLILINLAGNRLEYFDCGMLLNLQRPEISLTNNSLQTIRGCNASQLRKIHLQGNPLHCDCSLQVLDLSLGVNPGQLSPTCASPEEVRGLDVRVAVAGCSNTSTITVRSLEGTPKTKMNLSSEFSNHDYVRSTTTLPMTAVSSSFNITGPSVILQNNAQEESLILKDNDYSSVRNFLTEPSHRFYVTVTVTGLILIIIILIFSLLLKRRRRRQSQEGKGYPQGEQTYSNVESVRKDNHSESNPCGCPWFSFGQGKRSDSTQKTESPITNIDHNYARVANPSNWSYPRQFSSESESSNTTIVRLPGISGYPQIMVTGAFNPGMGAARCTCTSNFPDHDSQYSYGSFYTDSDESYQAENQLNEMCACRDGRADVPAWESQRLMSMDYGTPPPPYTPGIEQWSHQLNISPLPASRETENEPVYIQHDQI